MSEAVRYRVLGGVATLTMDQPETRNSLTPALLDGLAAGLRLAVADAAVRVVVLTNAGPTFCAGADLRTSPREGLDGLAGLLAALIDSPKPVVGRIAGDCMGGGVGLAAACDVSVASAEARLGFTEVRLGVAPAVVSVVCLPKMRRGDALELFLTGRRILAARAAEVGLISRAVPRQRLDEEVEDIVSQVLDGAPAALAAAKRLVFEMTGRPRGEAFDEAAELSVRLFDSEEAAEGIAAFQEKRRPRWSPA